MNIGLIPPSPTETPFIFTPFQKDYCSMYENYAKHIHQFIEIGHKLDRLYQLITFDPTEKKETNQNVRYIKECNNVVDVLKTLLEQLNVNTVENVRECNNVNVVIVLKKLLHHLHTFEKEIIFNMLVLVSKDITIEEEAAAWNERKLSENNNRENQPTNLHHIIGVQNQQQKQQKHILSDECTEDDYIREQKISHIVKSVEEITQISNQINRVVVESGTIVNNIMKTNVNVEKEEANKTQLKWKKRAQFCIFLCAIVILLLILVLIVNC